MFGLEDWEIAELAKYMLKSGKMEDSFDMEYEIKRFIEKESNGLSYHWYRTPSVTAFEIAEKLLK